MENPFVKESRYYLLLKPLWPLLLLGVLALLASLTAGSGAPSLRYERALVLAGDWWRVVTGQLVHLGPPHLALNLAGLALIGWIFGPGLRAGQWLVLLAASWLGIAAGFLMLAPQLAWYVGLSGLLHGLLLGAAVLDKGLDFRVRLVLVIGTLAKLGWEQWAGALPLTAEAAGGPVIVDAHLYGGLGGLLGAMALWVRDRVKASV